MRRFGIFTVPDYLALPKAHERWLIKPFIPAGGSAILYGSPKAGKSWLAIELALTMSGAIPEWLGYQADYTGPVVYLQLDNPDATWGPRFSRLMKLGVPMRGLHMLTRGTLEIFPFDILEPRCVEYLRKCLDQMNPFPSAIVIDTLRKVHSGVEDDSTVMENVLSNLIKATQPAALVLLHHNRKPSPDGQFDLMNDLRGSIHVPGSMDTIMRLNASNKGKSGILYFSGRDLEQDKINLYREPSSFWQAKIEVNSAHLSMVLADPTLQTIREKATKLSPLVGKSEDACRSIVFRAMKDAEMEIPESEKALVSTLT